MTPQLALMAFGAGLLVAIVTAPVGVSGPVILLPAQLDVLRIPSPAVTPTNLLFNVISTRGAILRYSRTGGLGVLGGLAVGLATTYVTQVMHG